ncbi:hypothetical protein HYX07_01205 [Candidatus Woesearchaeota archaeon]|nr:hypothetical protein [Candidatus Woesearchaeota archaeon]
MGQLSKEEWLRKRLRGNFLILDKNEFPKFTNSSYDSSLFGIINGAYAINNRLDDFLKIIGQSVVFDERAGNYRMDASNMEKNKKLLLKDKILSGLNIFELNPRGTNHLDFLEQLGAAIPENVKKNQIPISGEKAINLKNWSSSINGRYDITFSNELMDENSGIKYGNHSAVYSAFELYSMFANITRKSGFSIHSNGSAISSLYETYFQFIGFKVIEYFRNSDGSFRFTMIMEKLNDKQTSFDEFLYIYTELKKRWPTRYGN